MKTKIKIISLGLLITFSIPSIAISATAKEEQYCQTAYEMSCDEYRQKNFTPAEQAADDAAKKEQYCQTAYKTSCAEYTRLNATPAEKAAAADAKTAADAAAEEDSACKSASKDQFGEEMGCAAFNQKLENICIAAGYKSCGEKAVAEKNLRGTGFKLNLNALTLTSGGQKSGSAIFQNKDYAKYGVIVGTLMRVIDILIMLIGSLAMLTLVIAGIFMITNHGDEAWVNKGKTMMLYSILGILAALLSFAIVNVIQSALA